MDTITHTRLFTLRCNNSKHASIFIGHANSAEPACLKDQGEDENKGFLKQISSSSCELINSLVLVCDRYLHSASSSA